jgi:ABC-type polysaccharide/polyol phosphate export permease
MNQIKMLYRIFLMVRMGFSTWFRVQDILVQVFVSSVLYVVVFGFIFSRFTTIEYLIYITSGIAFIYSATIPIYPVGTLIHLAMGRTGYYSYVLPVPRWSIIAVRIIISIVLVIIATIITIASYWLIAFDVRISLLIVFPFLALLTLMFSLLYATLAYIIKDVPKYFTIVPSLSIILSLISTAYYPLTTLSYLPSILIEIATLNPISLSADICRNLLGVLSQEFIYKFLILIIEFLLILITATITLSKKLKI